MRERDRRVRESERVRERGSSCERGLGERDTENNIKREERRKRQSRGERDERERRENEKPIDTNLMSWWPMLFLCMAAVDKIP